MTRREAAALAFKLAGVYVIVQGVPLLYAVLQMFAMRDQLELGPLVHLAGILVLIILGTLAWVLLAHSERLAARTFAETDCSATCGASAQELQSVAFSVVGLCLFAAALPKIPSLVRYLVILARTPLSERPNEGFTFWRSVLGPGIQLVVGVALFFGATGISSLWQSTRTAGHPKPRKPDGLA